MRIVVLRQGECNLRDLHAMHMERDLRPVLKWTRLLSQLGETGRYRTEVPRLVRQHQS